MPKSDSSAVAALVKWWQGLGAQVVELSPGAHDALAAASSHVPHVAAAALAAATPLAALPLAAGGWLDTTRVASGDPALWVQILLSNRRHALTSLARYEKLILSFRQALERGDAARLERLLLKGKTIRDAVGS
jgi:prephenate dehydrogenase